MKKIIWKWVYENEYMFFDNEDDEFYGFEDKYNFEGTFFLNSNNCFISILFSYLWIS